MIFPEHCRAARAWLDWSQEELAKRAGVGLSTVRSFESGERTPMRANMEAIRAALEAGGVSPTYTNEGGPLGISLRDAQVALD